MLQRRQLDILLAWKNKKNRKPLVIRGARQVGKTFLVRMLGQTFANYIEINFDLGRDYENFKNVKSLAEFEQVLQTVYGKQLIPGKTLLFIDEIQNIPFFINQLRYFYELKPSLHVIAAGSLLEVILRQHGFGFPVGRVEQITLYPLDFFEFLQALGQNNLFNFLNSITLDTPIPQAIHQQAKNFFSIYARIGGMPEAVASYAKNPDLAAINKIHQNLQMAFKEDVFKYASMVNARYIKFVIENAPNQAGKFFSYENFADSAYKSREMANAFNVLEEAKILFQVKQSNNIKIPLQSKMRRRKKLLFLDVGFLNYSLGEIIYEQFKMLLGDEFRGRIHEQLVGQALLTQLENPIENLFVWAKTKNKGTAEVDFCFQHQAKIVGVEVKSGQSRSKSLLSFASQVPNHLLFKICHSFKETKTFRGADGKTITINILPFYLLPRLLDFCALSSHLYV